MSTQTAKQTKTIAKLFLVEFYTNEPNGRGGFKSNAAWDINFAWVYASHSTVAIDKLRKSQGARYCECIAIDEQSEIVPLAGEFRVNTPDANLFIIREGEGAVLEKGKWVALYAARKAGERGMIPR